MLLSLLTVNLLIATNPMEPVEAADGGATRGAPLAGVAGRF